MSLDKSPPIFELAWAPASGVSYQARIFAVNNRGASEPVVIEDALLSGISPVTGKKWEHCGSASVRAGHGAELSFPVESRSVVQHCGGTGDQKVAAPSATVGLSPSPSLSSLTWPAHAAS